MNLNRKSLVIGLSVFAFALIASSAYLLRDRFFAADQTTVTALAKKSFTIKVVDANDVPVPNAEVAVVWAKARDLARAPYTGDYLVKPVLNTSQDFQFVTGDMPTSGKEAIKADSKAALLIPEYNVRMLDPFDESQSIADYGWAWYNHHIATSSCSFEPCFIDSMVVTRITNKEDAGTDASGNVVYKMSYLGDWLNRDDVTDMYVTRIYVRYNGQTTIHTLFDGATVRDTWSKMDSGPYTEKIKLTVTSPIAVNGEAGVSVLVKNLQEQPVQGAKVEMTFQCYKNGVESFNSNTLPADAISLTTDGTGIAKLSGAAWQSKIVDKLGFDQTACPQNKQKDSDSIGGVTYTKSLSVLAYFGESRVTGFVKHGPFPFLYNGSYADQIYIDTLRGAAYSEPNTGDPSFSIQSFVVEKDNIDYNTPATISWTSVGASKCEVTPNNSAAAASWTTAPNGTIVTSNYVITTNKTLTCTSATDPNKTATANLTVHVKPGFAVQPTNNREATAANPIANMDHAVINWKVEGADTCKVTSPAQAAVAATGSDPDRVALKELDVEITPSVGPWTTSALYGRSDNTYVSSALLAPRTFTVTCSNSVGSISKEVPVVAKTGGATTFDGVCVVDTTANNPNVVSINGKYGVAAACENKSIRIVGPMTVNADLVEIARPNSRASNNDPNFKDTIRIFDNVTLVSGAVLTHDPHMGGDVAKRKINWITYGNFNLSNSFVNVDGKGYPGGASGAISATACPAAGIASAGGGTPVGTLSTGGQPAQTYYQYAGSGALSGAGGPGINTQTNAKISGGVPIYTSTTAYANDVMWFNVGGGGGGAHAVDGTSFHCWNGGAGGGRILLDVNNALVISGDSKITANGASATEIAGSGGNADLVAGGAGAGGMIRLYARAYYYPSADPVTSFNVYPGIAATSHTGTYGKSYGLSQSSRIQAAGGSARKGLDGNYIATASSGGGGLILVNTK